MGVINNTPSKEIILTADSLIFNSRGNPEGDPGIVFSSDYEIALSSNKGFHVNIDNSDGKIILNSSEIRIGPIKGTDSFPNNPAVKGDELEKLLMDILNHLDLLYNTVLPVLHQITIFPGLPTVPSPANTGAIAPLISEIKALKGKVKRIKSDKVYIK